MRGGREEESVYALGSGAGSGVALCSAGGQGGPRIAQFRVPLQGHKVKMHVDSSQVSLRVDGPSRHTKLRMRRSLNGSAWQARFSTSHRLLVDCAYCSARTSSGLVPTHMYRHVYILRPHRPGL
mgnify:CR=1 FL=1